MTKNLNCYFSQELRDRAQVTGSGFGLYCYYGCHCLTDDDHINEEYGLVGGKPIDNIDKTCQQMGTCYRCLQDKYKGNISYCTTSSVVL